MKLARISRVMTVALVVGLSGIVAPAVFAAPPMDVVTIHYTGVIDRVDDPDGVLDGSVEVGGFFHGSYTFNAGIEVDHYRPGWDRYLYREKAPAGMTFEVTVGNYTFENKVGSLTGFDVKNNYIVGGRTKDEYHVNTHTIGQTAGPDLGLLGILFEFVLTTYDHLDAITGLPRAMPPLEKFERINRFYLDLLDLRGVGVQVYGHLTDDAVVPDVVGLRLHEARLEISNHDLSVGEVEYDYSETVPEDRVISQDPAAGTRVPAGFAVDLVVSLGRAPVMVPVPAVEMQPLAEAQLKIISVSLEVGDVDYVHSDTVPAGFVVSQYPAAGTLVTAGSEVHLQVSLGPETVEVPNVVGRLLAEAESRITAADLIVGEVDRAYSSTVARDRVITQNPAAGTEVKVGSAVDLLISLGPAGPELVVVPDVVGMPLFGAKSAITTAGLVVGATSGQYSDAVPEGSVISQEPRGGTSAPMGFAVDLVLSIGPAGGESVASLALAFAFGSRLLECPTYSVPSANYTMVYHGTPAELQYNPARGWGYEVLYPIGSPYGGRAGYGIFGPFDDSPNNREKFADDCPEQLYDSFIGAKDFTSECSELTIGDPDTPCAPTIDPEGIIFRVDVPNGTYRFVAAVGDADNVHAHRIIAEDGGTGPPELIGPNHVVLVHNFDQAQQTIGEAEPGEPGEGVYARVGFDGKIPPPGDGVFPSPQFLDMDRNGFATAGAADSPVLEVTQGYIRIHQLQGNSNDGPGGPRDGNGGDMVILELWKIETEPEEQDCLTESGDLVGIDIGGSLPAGVADPTPTMCWDITGGGADIWATADQFYYAAVADPEYPDEPKKIEGDFTAIVGWKHMEPYVTGHEWAKAGIMARA
ncbi:MAG: PASTA domain-containing protein, partial [Phycisphaerales bacterium]